MKKSIFVLSFVLVTNLFISCTKEGPVGPAGTNGNANVTVQNFTVNSWNGNSTEYDWYTNLNVTALTTSAQNNGAVQVFLSTNNGTTWRALPFTYFDGSVTYFMGFTTITNNVEVYWNFTGTGMAYDANAVYSTNCQFKVVVIPPVTAKRKDVNWTNYEELKDKFDLAD